MKNFLKKYAHAWVLLYIFIYMPWFMYLENTYSSLSSCTIIHVAFDDVIPFCEYFIIPYLLWFLYVPSVILFLFFTSKKEYYHTCAFLFIGMSICLFICTIFPNGQNLRAHADLVADKNIFTKLIATLYKTDTDTNVFPSIHAFNSIGIHIAICKNQILSKKIWIKISSFLLATLIILSTMFLKQHSVLDVCASFLLAALLYVPVYKVNWSNGFNLSNITQVGEADK